MDSARTTGAWPEADLEYVGECPICGSPERSLMYDDLEDWSFRAAPGRWTMWSCRSCSTAYLDPRPTEDSIGLAYQNYYTHQDEEPLGAELTDFVGKLKSKAKFRMRKGYYRLAFGYDASVFELIGGILLRSMPDMASEANLMIRNLARPSQTGERLLDVGCGSGAFLRIAADFGYQAIGMDPDAKAVEAVRRSGLEVRHGGLPATGFPDGYFMQVTLSHVFEHLHHPRAALAEVWRILRPGGRLWMALPNRDALGLEIFGKYWRGLEAPRHLALPSRTALRDLLMSASFSNIAFPEHPRCGRFQTVELIRRIDGDPRARADRCEIMIVTADKKRG
jgi:SAM-dependent methyltransferase